MAYIIVIAVIVLIIILYVIGYILRGILDLIDFFLASIRGFVTKCREQIKKKRYNKSLLGKIEVLKKIINSKKDEINNALKALKEDVRMHDTHIKDMNLQLKKDISKSISEEINKHISRKISKKTVIRNYIEIFEDALLPLQRNENDIVALSNIIKFNQESQSLDQYSEQFDNLKRKIKCFSKFDFVELSRNAIIGIAQIAERAEIKSALAHIKEIEESNKNTSRFDGNLGLEKLEERQIKNLENQITSDFKILKKELKKLI